MTYAQYEILLVNFDPTIGCEIKKTRPCVVISPNEMNNNIQTLIVAPMTSQSKPYPSRVTVEKNSFIVLDQIRTIDKRCVIKKIAKLQPSSIKKVKTIIKEMLVD